MKRPAFRSLLHAAPAFFALVVGALPVHGGELTLADRVKAQAAIERVYYSHQVGADKPFENSVSQEALRDKVVRYLKQSAALEEFWHTSVTAEMLARELQRMIDGTRMPERLQELFAALDHDPILIQECLARPTLVDRLVRSFHASDPRSHDVPPVEADTTIIEKTPWDRWWITVSPGLDIGAIASVAAPEISLMDGVPGVPCVEDDTWDNGALLDVPDPRADHTVVWTGTEMIVWGGYVGDNAAWRYDPAIDSWTRSTTVNAPPANTDASAVWTGTEMIVWGGHDDAAGRYDPVSDTWTAISTVDAPESRLMHTAVWTGSRMLVWGGASWDGDSYTIYDTGGQYDPATDSWTAMTTSGAPTPRWEHTAVWTGTEMIVWGGDGDLDTGGRYDPATDSWTATSTVGAPVSEGNHTAVWTGTVMIVWGASGSDSGSRYYPSSDTWAEVSDTGAPPNSSGQTAVWTGTEMIVWNGGTNPGGRYNPVSDSWIATSAVGAPVQRSKSTAVWTGSRMIVWGGYGDVNHNTGGRYDPATDSWTPTASGSGPAARWYHSAVWTGSHMIVWGGNSPDVTFDSGGKYDPALDSWTATSTIGAPSARVRHTAVWAGGRMIVWGGEFNGYLNTGGRYDPVADRWTAMSTSGAPEPRRSYAAVSTGERMLVWGGELYDYETQSYTYFDDGGEYDPATDSWTVTPSEGAPSARSRHTAVWTGSHTIVWGGKGETGDLNTGASYDPLAGDWQPTSTGWNVAGSRSGHGAVWTGTEMIVWGGTSASGGRYDPASDSWVRTSTLNTPKPAVGSSAVWLGGHMVVWSGYEGEDGYLDSGGRYDPVADTWEPMSTVNEPSPGGRTTVSTGSYMLVWGGWFAYNVQYDTGGRYALGHMSDEDGDSFSDCDGDCDDGHPWVYPWAPEVCDDVDNQCPGEFGHGQIDVGCNDDGDDYCDPALVTVGQPMVCPAGTGDCDDTNLYVYPGAPEVNDGVDNQCPGDPGHGIVDEITGVGGFHDPSDANEYSWPEQSGVALYEVVRSGSPDLSDGCSFWTTPDTAIATEDPAMGSAHFYLVRPLSPHTGSWGRDSSGEERGITCSGD